jgi:hypothetical protein
LGECHPSAGLFFLWDTEISGLEVWCQQKLGDLIPLTLLPENMVSEGNLSMSPTKNLNISHLLMKDPRIETIMSSYPGSGDLFEATKKEGPEMQK